MSTHNPFYCIYYASCLVLQAFYVPVCELAVDHLLIRAPAAGGKKHRYTHGRTECTKVRRLGVPLDMFGTSLHAA